MILYQMSQFLEISNIAPPPFSFRRFVPHMGRTNMCITKIFLICIQFFLVRLSHSFLLADHQYLYFFYQDTHDYYIIITGICFVAIMTIIVVKNIVSFGITVNIIGGLLAVYYCFIFMDYFFNIFYLNLDISILTFYIFMVFLFYFNFISTYLFLDSTL